MGFFLRHLVDLRVNGSILLNRPIFRGGASARVSGGRSVYILWGVKGNRYRGFKSIFERRLPGCFPRGDRRGSRGISVGLGRVVFVRQAPIEFGDKCRREDY